MVVVLARGRRHAHGLGGILSAAARCAAHDARRARYRGGPLRQRRAGQHGLGDRSEDRGRHGRAWLGRERALDVPDGTPPSPQTTAPLRYILQTTVPVNWIPFVPVQIDAARRSVALERATMERFVDGRVTAVPPVGRVLRPTNLADAN